MLSTENLTIRFGGHVAVNAVSCSFQPGTLTAIVGPNGAGKTTYFNLISGQLKATAGSVKLGGRDLTGLPASSRTRAGLGRAFQLTNLFPHLTVLENVRLALQRKLGTSYHFWRSSKSLHQLDDRARQLLAEVGLEAMADEVTVNLPYGRKRALEIATTLAMEPELMLLDEPTQGMGHEDVDRVTQLIKKVSAGRTILMVEHNMKVVSTIADRITVLQRGAVLAEGRYEEVSRNPQVMEAYMGTTDGQLNGH